MRKMEDFWVDLGIYGAVGFQVAITVVAGWLIGDYFDEKWGLSPWLAITGLVIGFVGGLYNLIRVLRWQQRRKR